MKSQLDQTLDELEGTVTSDDSEWQSYVVINCQRLQRVPLKDFTIEDLRLMTGQHFSLNYLVPLALDALESNPLAEGVFYEGDLLASVSRVPLTFWEQHPALYERWQEVLITVANIPLEILEELDLPNALLAALPGQPYRKRAMPYRLKVYYPRPEDTDRETRISTIVAEEGGQLDFREVSPCPKAAICLTYEFAMREQAEQGAIRVRHLGVYVEGPCLYGD